MATFSASLGNRRRNAGVPILALACLGLGACAGLTTRDPLSISVAGIEPLPGEGLELRLAVNVRVQNPNDLPVEYTGVALDLALNGRTLATGVSDSVGVVPRYGETTFTVPVTISAFNVARQLVGFMNGSPTDEIEYRVRGKLEGGLFGTRRFSDEGSFVLRLPDQAL
jgi:hypothetical protein